MKHYKLPNIKSKSFKKKLKHLPKIIGIGFLALLALIALNLVLELIIIWFSGIQLGFNPYDGGLSDTQRAQVGLETVVIGSLILIVFLRLFLKRRTKSFWRYMRRELYVILPLALIFNLGYTSYLFYKGQNGGDYGCNSEIGLDIGTIYNATYPISTNIGEGTAFAIDPHGTLITAYHVIQGAKWVSVSYNTPGTWLKVVKTSPRYDLALLKYSQPTPDYLPLSSTYQVGDPVYAIGWPQNVDYSGEASLVSGIVSRDITASDADASGNKQPPHMSLIQTDAAINPGNSGGPLVDTCGAIGVIDATSVESNGLVDQGIGYATSNDTIKYAFGSKY